MDNPPEQTAAEMATAGGVVYDNDEFEFVELINTDAAPANLAGMQFTNGIGVVLDSHVLAPGEHAVVVRNQAAFASRYGMNPRVVGVYGGTIDDYRLANEGERLVLQEPGGAIVHDFAYDDRGLGWHATTDGEGASLVALGLGAPVSSWSLPMSWRASFAIGGSPGGPDLMPGDVDGNERVDLADLAAVQTRIGASGVTRALGDVSGDGAVTRIDIAIVAANFGRSYTPPPAASPTPASNSVLRASRRARLPGNSNIAVAVDHILGESKTKNSPMLTPLRSAGRRT
jgi:hypothetical protein